MKQLLRRLQRLLGIDGAISYTIMGKGVGVITTIFTVFFIARYLSPDEQGYYYTFASILSIQVFFELGLNNIITQFVAHEASYLTLNQELKFEGPERNKSRLADLLRFCVKWYAIFAVILLVALLVVGVFFFKKYSDVEVDIKAPRLNQDIEKLISLMRMINMQIAVKKDDETHLLDIEKILYIETVERNTFVYTEDATYESDLKLYEIEQELLEQSFSRISKQSIINLKKVKSLKADINRKIRVTLVNGEQIIVSRMYSEALRKRLGIK